MVDVPWNGFTVSKKVADLAESYEVNVAPHNYYSHLSTLISAHLCACVPNVQIMEVDVDDVPWKDDLIDAPPAIENGEVVIADGPGWGAGLVEEVARDHPWSPEKMEGGRTIGVRPSEIAVSCRCNSRPMPPGCRSG